MNKILALTVLAALTFGVMGCKPAENNNQPPANGGNTPAPADNNAPKPNAS